MADRLIVPMDSYVSWLAGIATCTGDIWTPDFMLYPTLCVLNNVT
jgi:hypothetical protein